MWGSQEPLLRDEYGVWWDGRGLAVIRGFTASSQVYRRGCDGGRFFLLRLYRLWGGSTLSHGQVTLRPQRETGVDEDEGRAPGYKGYRISWFPAGDQAFRPLASIFNLDFLTASNSIVFQDCRNLELVPKCPQELLEVVLDNAQKMDHTLGK